MPSLNQITPSAVIQNLSTAIGLFTSTKQVDVVKILNQQTMQQVFAAARPLKAVIKETAKVMQYPVETGATLSDNRVSNPTEIEMMVFLPASAYTSVYPQMRTAWQAPTLLSVQTRTGTYRNMIIMDMPHEEESDIASAVTIHLKFKEVIMIAPSAVGGNPILANFSPAQPQAQNTLNTGLVQGLAAASSVLSYFHAATVVGL